MAKDKEMKQPDLFFSDPLPAVNSQKPEEKPEPKPELKRSALIPKMVNDEWEIY